MSVTTDTTAAVAEATEVTVTPQASTPTVVLPASERDVTPAELVDRAVLLIIAGNADPAQREALDQRAFKALVNHMVKADRTPEDDRVEHLAYELPVYGMNGEESLRYTKQRAALLINIAQAFGVMGEMTYRKYTYAGGRRQYRVQLFGAKVDIARSLAAFKPLQTRVIKDGYALELDPALKPAQQTKARRTFFADYAASIGSTLDAVTDKLPKAEQAKISDRMTAAEKAKGEFAAEEAVRAAQGETAEVSESTDES